VDKVGNFGNRFNMWRGSGFPEIDRSSLGKEWCLNAESRARWVQSDVGRVAPDIFLAKWVDHC